MIAADTLANDSLELEQQVLRFVQSYADPFFFTLLVSQLGLAILIYISSGNPWILAWFALLCVVIKITKAQRSKIFKLAGSQKFRMRRAVSVNMVDGSAIATVLIFMPTSDNLTRIMMIVVLLVTSTASIVSCAGYRKLFIAFNLPIVSAAVLGCVALVVFYRAPGEFYLLALIALLTCWGQLVLSSGVYAAIRDAKLANLHNKATNLKLKDAVHQARKANESKTRFLASASHDLRQPISVLSLSILSLQMLTTDRKETEIINNMDLAIQNIDAQLTSLLDISKLDAGIVEVNPRIVDLVPLVRNLVEPHKVDVKGAVQVNFHSNVRVANVKIDEQLFARIVNNLISNAHKYTRKGKIDVLISSNASELFVSIIDTGVGIAESDLGSVFDEFFQVDNSQRDSKKGLGLGLSIVQRLCALLKIKLSIRSELQRGTAVMLSMPRSNALVESVVAQNKSVKVPRSLNILALDNERAILEALEKLLRNMGHRVTTCEDAEQALHLFVRDNFDLALIDYRLSDEQNGLDVITKIKQISPSMRCFLVTGENSIELEDLDVEVIYKPITRKKLAQIFA